MFALRVASLALTLALASVARAQPPSEDAGAEPNATPDPTAHDEEARNLFEAGEQAFRAGSYERALADFRQAYELSHRDELLYNIGVAADRLRHDDEALEAFTAYLASPSVDERLRPEVEGRVAVLRRTVSASDTSDTSDDEARPPPDLTGAIVVVTIGGVLVVASAIFFGVGAAESDAVANAPMDSAWADYSGRLETANGLFTAGAAAAGLGLGMVAVGSIVIAASPGPADAPTVAIGPTGVTVRGTF